MLHSTTIISLIKWFILFIISKIIIIMNDFLVVSVLSVLRTEGSWWPEDLALHTDNNAKGHQEH